MVDLRQLQIDDIIVYDDIVDKVTEVVSLPNKPLGDIYFIATKKHIGYVDNDVLKYVSITSDMLINNGFKKDTVGSGLIYNITGAENLYVLVNFRHDGSCRNVEISNGYYNLSVPVNYVHELQHALRVSGLNEMAKNFEV